MAAYKKDGTLPLLAVECCPHVFEYRRFSSSYLGYPSESVAEQAKNPNRGPKIIEIAI